MRTKPFKCEQCGEVDYVLFDGYSVGDRLLEGVMFQIRRDPPKMRFKATPDGAAADYMKSARISIARWCKEIERALRDGEETGECPKCQCDVEIAVDTVTVEGYAIPKVLPLVSGIGVTDAIKATASSRPEPPKITPKTIRCAIIVDPAGYGFGEVTREDEIEAHKATFEKLLSPARLVFETPYAVDPERLDADLVVFDFGGMGPGNDLMGDNSRQLIRWMDDHSSSLVVVMSSFTYRHGILPELEDRGLSPAMHLGSMRVVPLFENPPSPLPNLMLYSRLDDKLDEAIKAWFR